MWRKQRSNPHEHHYWRANATSESGKATPPDGATHVAGTLACAVVWLLLRIRGRGGCLTGDRARPGADAYRQHLAALSGGGALGRGVVWPRLGYLRGVIGLPGR